MTKNFSLINYGVVSSKDCNKVYNRPPSIVLHKSKCIESRIFLSFRLKENTDIFERVILTLFIKNIKLYNSSTVFKFSFAHPNNIIDYSTLSFSESVDITIDNGIYSLSKSMIGKYIDFDITNYYKANYTIGKRVDISIIPIEGKGEILFASSATLSICTKLKASKKIYGDFSSLHHEPVVIEPNNLHKVIFDTTNCSNLLKIDNGDIIFKKNGVFKVDYGLNSRVSLSGVMFLSVNKQKINYSITEIGADNIQSYGHIISSFNKEDKLSLYVKGSDVVFISTGSIARILITEI